MSIALEGVVLRDDETTIMKFASILSTALP